MAEMLHRRRFTADEYRRMGESGILADDERLELIAGHIVVREPIGARHAGTVDRLTRLWTSRLGERAIVRIQNPVRFAKEDSELQPNVMLLRPRDDFYFEVMDTSVRLERRVRIPLYARAGVRETWICDLVSRRLDVHRDLAGRRYRAIRTLARGDRLGSLEFPDVVVAVEDLLG